MNKHASALGKRAKGKKKTLTPAELERRKQQLDRVRVRRHANDKLSHGGDNE